MSVATIIQKPGTQIVILVSVVVIAMGAMLFQRYNRPAEVTEGEPPPGMGQQAPEQIPRVQNDDAPESFEAVVERLSLPKAKPPEPEVQVMSADRGKQEQAERQELPSLVMVENRYPAREFEPTSPRIFAPRGMLIRAILVLTVDSSNMDTPVLGLVSEDVYWGGNLIVPAGTQVHASASTGRMRDRIEVNGAYTFVWDDGREYKINATALDHQIMDDGTFSLTDGSAGIKGEILKTDKYAELKLLLAEVFSGLAANSQETVDSVFGPVPENNLSNAGFEGISQAGDRYSELLFNRIEDDLEFVRIVAGTEFYIFTLDVFEPELASIGGLLQGNEAKSSWQLAQEAHDRAQVQNMATSAVETGQATGAEAARLRQNVQQQNDYIDRVRTILQTNSTPPPTPTAESTP